MKKFLEINKENTYKKNSITNILIGIISIFTTIGMQLDISLGMPLEERFSHNSVISVIAFLFIFFLISEVKNIKDRRIIILTTILSIIFSTIEIVGFYLDKYQQLHFSKACILKLLSYLVLFYCAISIIFIKIKNFKDKNNHKFYKLSNKKVFFFSWILIIICWIPYLIKYYPGVMTPDSILQAGQAIVYGLNSHHPMFHTLIIKVCLTIGNCINDYNLGVAIYSIMQMLAMSSIFAYTILYMYKKNLPQKFYIIVLVFFAIYPVFGIYSITMWKDILFAGAMLLYTIQVVELIHNTDKYIYSIKCNIVFIISVLLVVLLRNNGIYAIVLSIPIMIMALKKYWKRLCIIYILPIVVYSIFNSFCYNIIHANKGNVAEAFSVPMQQIARVVKYHKNELTNEEKDKINIYIPVEDVESLYDSRISDPIKNTFNSIAFKENKMSFFKLWFDLFKKYPRDYIESFLYNSYGYWYPDTIYWIYATGIGNNDFGIEQTGLKDLKLLDKLTEYRNIPVISMIYSIGFAFFIILFVIVYLIYEKKYKYILSFITIIALWITTLASPVYCEYRYIFSIFTCLPILISTIMINKENKLK